MSDEITIQPQNVTILRAADLGDGVVCILLGGLDANGDAREVQITSDGLVACALPDPLKRDLESLRDEWIHDCSPGDIFGHSIQDILDRYWPADPSKPKQS